MVAAYLDHRDLAEAETEAERFFINVVLCRLLYAHALVAAPRISLGWLRSIAPLLGDPRLGWPGSSCSSLAFSPTIIRSATHAETYLGQELGFGRLLDFGVITPRLQQLYDGRHTNSPRLACWIVSMTEP